MSINLFPVRTSRPAVSLEGLDEAALQHTAGVSEIANRTGARGIGGGRILEPVPGFISSDSEKVIANENNSSIQPRKTLGDLTRPVLYAPQRVFDTFSFLFQE